jgi:hypothetical protein
VSQTIAILVGAYRAVNSQKLFWLSLVLSGLVVAVFACLGINHQGVKVLVWQFDTPWYNSDTTPPAIFYKDWFVGLGIGFWLSWLAAILALISTAGIFPQLISSGNIDLYVSKPIGRLRLFVSEYLAGLLFVTLQVTVFSVASLLVIGIRGGAWEPGLLVAVPLVVCFFSYLYSVCVLLGVLTRSTVAALFLTLLFWFIVFLAWFAERNLMKYQAMERRGVGIQAERQRPVRPPASGGHIHVSDQTAAEDQSATASEPSPSSGVETARQSLHAVNTLLPKTSETIGLLRRWLVRLADLPPTPDDQQLHAMLAAERDVQEAIDRRSPFWVLGTSLGFELVILSWAAWVFCRRDY